jgi:hypothetical protein
MHNRRHGWNTLVGCWFVHCLMFLHSPGDVIIAVEELPSKGLCSALTAVWAGTDVNHATSDVTRSISFYGPPIQRERGTEDLFQPWSPRYRNRLKINEIFKY